eukprot:NODE_347_length_1607_cov_39.561486_g315_i0.p1 GENE.NODE_347_length_1607_cov_39.561486_g315_i0~~NODE_347_length_1607_cov_39.561486_g315_i0.p1  ORF type:complete len:484 (+),score=72.80 NODE_347_length_1607_cov_39.561486_g315_i0:83-1534(+)
MNWWLIVVAVIVGIVVVGCVAYLMVVFSSPDDKNQAWWPKIVVILSLSLACFAVLLLPFDVANKAKPDVMASVGGGLNVGVIWQVVLISIVVFVVVVIPFTLMYYEAADPDKGGIAEQLIAAFGYTLLAVLVYGLALTILWLTVGNARIPYQLYESPMVVLDGKNHSPGCDTCYSSKETLDLKVSIFIYAVALLAILGWALLIVFGGIGIVALPMDLLRDWLYRPKPIGSAEYHKQRTRIGEKSHQCLKEGQALDVEQRSQSTGISNKLKRKVNKLRFEVEALEADYAKLEIAYKQRGWGPFVAWGKLLLGLLGVCLSVLWVIHVFLFNMTLISPFLNEWFILLDNAFSLLGVMFYGIFSFYLLWAIVKGVTKVGMRLLFFEVHPMKVGDTLMNSFLFNCLLILAASITTTQFCAMSFREYATETAIDSMFSTYIRHLQGIGLIFRYFQWAFEIVAVLTVLLMVFCCTGKKARKKNRYRAPAE